MDGVIIDSEPIQSKSIEMVLEKYKIKPMYLENGLLHPVGLTGDAVYADILHKHNADIPINVFVKERRTAFEKLIKKKLKPTKGFKSLIKILKKNNFRISLSSNRRLSHIHTIVKNLNVSTYFNVIVGPSETIRFKPNPDIFLETAKQLNVVPNQCIVIEDSEVGIQAAKSAGMKVIAIPNTYTKHHDFSKADKIVKSLNDVNLKLINSI